MSRKKRKNMPVEEQVIIVEEKTKKAKTASLRAMPHSGPVPVKPIATNIQLTPIVQPLAFVPYSTQEQPLLTYDGGYEEVVEENETSQEEMVYEQPVSTKRKKRVNWVSIFLLITSLLLLATLIIGKLVDGVLEYTAIVSEQEVFISGFGLVERLIDNIQKGDLLLFGNIIPASIAATAVFALLTLIISLIRICKRGAGVLGKITTFFTLAFILVVLVMAITDKMTMCIGLYIVVGIAFVQMVVAYLADGGRRKG